MQKHLHYTYTTLTLDGTGAFPIWKKVQNYFIKPPNDYSFWINVPKFI